MIDHETERTINSFGLELTPIKTKPWGFTAGIQPNSIEKFVDHFFPEAGVQIKRVSPRFLIVNPKSRLSWQVHKRRIELWKVVKGPVGVMLSQTDKQPDSPKVEEAGSVIKIGPEVRHRLVGLSKPAIVAEIWIYTDVNNPSDATDIVRLSDDYER